ncbi:MATE family efflux transporter [Aliigemmobacter aestuarii]|uniref:Multidrug-efflux transporter n=1 Tax=Aliigemmobacter aestuarii TaxID=1445661 RepID=A0A4S3MJW4_9RHOB|nr:MATE family efflux transporter [Gemmobacter aestuarii]THD82194.1 MATE family efflux transporter [Gemmobacter aestuarii]
MTANTSPHHARAILVLGLPLIGSHLAQFGLHVTDTIMLGWYGVLPLAAGVLGASTFFVVFILGSGSAKAVLPLVATAHGQDDDVQVRRVTRMGLWQSAMFGVICYPLFWWSAPVLLALGQKPDVAALASDYLRIAGLGMIPALWVMVLKSYLAAMGRTQVVLWVTVAAVFVNAALNWALIFGNWGAPELGVLGSAVATVAVQVFSVVILCAYAALLPSLRRFQLFVRFWRADWPAFAQVFRLGAPMALTGLAESGLFHASALMMGWIGTVELAAHGIALEITALTFMVHVGLSNAVTVLTGRAYGAGDAAGLRLGAKVAIVMSLAFAGVTVLLFLLLPEPMIAVFLDDADPDRAAILAIGTTLLACAALFQLADAAQVMALGLLAGVQDTRVPMIYAAISYWLIGIPVSYALAFPLGLGPAGLWLGLVVGLACAAASLMARFWRRAPAPETAPAYSAAS